MADDNTDSKIDPTEKLRGVLRGMMDYPSFTPSEGVESINLAIEELADELNAEAAAISIERVPCAGCGMPTPALLAPADYQRDGSPRSFCKSCVEGHAADDDGNDAENDGHGPMGMAGGGPLPFLEVGDGGTGDGGGDDAQKMRISNATISITNGVDELGTPSFTVSMEKTPVERAEDLKDRLRRKGLDE
jgi:hypothetical protein